MNGAVVSTGAGVCACVREEVAWVGRKASPVSCRPGYVGSCLLHLRVNMALWRDASRTLHGLKVLWKLRVLSLSVPSSLFRSFAQ